MATLIPQDAWNIILAEFPLRRLLRLRATCRYLRDIVYNYYLNCVDKTIEYANNLRRNCYAAAIILGERYDLNKHWRQYYAIKEFNQYFAANHFHQLNRDDLAGRLISWLRFNDRDFIAADKEIVFVNFNSAMVAKLLNRVIIDITFYNFTDSDFNGDPLNDDLPIIFAALKICKLPPAAEQLAIPQIDSAVANYINVDIREGLAAIATFCDETWPQLKIGEKMAEKIEFLRSRNNESG